MTPKTTFPHCPHCSTERSIRKSCKGPHPRSFCLFPNCKSTFTRPSDLARHKKTIHGLKRKCVYAHCKYATARVDKMAEHMRRLHAAKDPHILEQFSQGTGLGCSFLDDVSVPSDAATPRFTEVNAYWSRESDCLDLWMDSWDISSFTGSLTGNFDLPYQPSDSASILQETNVDLLSGVAAPLHIFPAFSNISELDGYLWTTGQHHVI